MKQGSSIGFTAKQNEAQTGNGERRVWKLSDLTLSWDWGRSLRMLTLWSLALFNRLESIGPGGATSVL